MANPLAKVIRYIVTGGTITAGDVQAAIEQLETITTGINALLLSHNTRHEDGGADEISVQGLSGLLADQQDPLAHASRHQDGGSDEIDVTGLSGLLADLQYAGYIGNVVIDLTGLSNNFVLQYNAGLNKWFVTNTLTGVTPGAHESTHIEGGSDQIVGELLSPQKAGKIFSAVIDITGLADKWVLRYDNGTSTWKAQTFNHAADHEFGQVDAIPSLPNPQQKSALAGTVGTPDVGNEYVTKQDKDVNIDPVLPTVDQKNALDGSSSPSLTNPFVTQNELNSLVSSGTGIRQAAQAAFIYDPSIDKKGTPLTYNVTRGVVLPLTDISVKPFSLIDRYCTRQTGINAGSTTFNATGTITVTNNQTVMTVSSIVIDDGFGHGELTLTAPVPAFIQVGDEVTITGTVSNNRTYTVYSISGSILYMIQTFAANEVGVGTATSIKFKTGSVIVVTGTALNNENFTITDVTGNVLTVTPVPVNETVAATIDQYRNNGSIISFGLMILTDPLTPHNFNLTPTTIETYQFDSSADHYGLLDYKQWIIGRQVNASAFFVDIHENSNYGTIPVVITAGAYVPTIERKNIICDTSGGNIIVNLPTIDTTWDGKEVQILLRVAGNTVLINADTGAGDDINGSGSIPAFSTLYTSYTLLAHYDVGGSYWSIK